MLTYLGVIQNEKQINSKRKQVQDRFINTFWSKLFCQQNDSQKVEFIHCDFLIQILDALFDNQKSIQNKSQIIFEVHQ